MADNTTLTATEFIELKFKDYEHKDKLLENIKDTSRKFSTERSKADFLWLAFFWHKSKEGAEFWNKEFNKLLKANK